MKKKKWFISYMYYSYGDKIFDNQIVDLHPFEWLKTGPIPLIYNNPAKVVLINFWELD